ncbi:glycosyltransferase [Termitidicoccus mucosus]|uniref:Glycosyl transferase n=1 Tax=Termitidicoccus mucosus TaxID=1184151 RepID=A0A178IQ12_9BACT|nr:glycosyl transferase [Opitutaceae bacterium TSB47]
MASPLVSICIPAFKAAGFIGETLESIRTQLFPDWELIVVEDGSDDGTEAIVRAFARSLSQPVSFLRHDVNLGLPATRNTAIAHASGEWIALIDSDDLWEPGHLAALLQRADRDDVDLVHSGVVMFDSDTGATLEHRVPSADALAGFPRSLFVADYIIQPSSTLIRRSLCRRVGGFDPGFRYVEDREFWLRLVRCGARVAYVDSLTCRYRQHAGAMTRRAAEMAVGVAQVFERNADWELVPRALRLDRAAGAWLSAGRIVLRENPRDARRHFARGLRHRPGSPRLLAYWCAAALLGAFRKDPRAARAPHIPRAPHVA